MPDAVTELSRRERLLIVGRDAFGRLPYDEVSLSDVAKEAGVAHGLPFHYFTNKYGFFVEVVRSIAQEMRVVHAVGADLPPAAAIRALTHQHIDYFEMRPHALLGPVRSDIGADSRVRAVFDEARWDGALLVLGLLGIDEPTDGVRLVMRAWLAYHDDLLARWLVDRGFNRDRIVETLVAALVAALESVTHLEPGTRLDLSALRS